MKVLISWSGDRSKQIAEALAEWLPTVLQVLKPWMSSKNIRSGTPWYTEVTNALESHNVGIICLTPENINEPWINFEAGALSKLKQEVRVCTFLYELSPEDLMGPLAQFQHTLFEKSSVNKLLHDYNELLKEPVDKKHLHSSFNAFWPGFEETLKAIPSLQSDTAKNTRSEKEIMVEILHITRGLEETVQKMSAEGKDPIVRFADLVFQKLTPLVEQEALTDSDAVFRHTFIKAMRDLAKGK